MELKPYQRRVLNDLDLYLQYVEERGDYAKAFEDFVGDRTIQSDLGLETAPKYKDSIPGVPHVCLKVPTAGGKTFIAAHAIDVIYRHYPDNRAKMIVWLVPSLTILEQTLGYLRNPGHPYRRKINTHFRNRVEIFDKDTLMQGTGFNSTSVHEQLNIAVLTFDSLRTRLKESRKMYQENSQLASFETAVKEDEQDEVSLINVLRTLRPVVIVDEAHGATGELSIDMLSGMHPSFVLDITATPKKRSNNILTQVHAIELKKENMVKLPVLVYNHSDITGVIESAIHLQEKLERDAVQERKAGGAYIRPIVLFQAQPRNAADTGTYTKIKKLLIDIGVPEEQVKIKTADINEIKNIDLFAEDCPVRFIITINALKEGWDCSFAYILASLADRSSQTDVQQIVGRILRQPYARMHRNEMLNYSYILTSSTKFIDTVKSIVEGLNMSGFGEHDYIVAENQLEKPLVKEDVQVEPGYIGTETSDIDQVDINSIQRTANEKSADVIHTLQHQASEANRELQKNIEALPGEEGLFYNLSDTGRVNTFRMRDEYKEQGEAIRLPMFFIKVPGGGYLFDGHEEAPLTRETLLEDFRLRHADSNISFELGETNLYQIDLKNTVGKDSRFEFSQLPSVKEKNLIDYFLSQPREAQLKQLSGKLSKKIQGSMPHLPESDLLEYVSRIVSGFDADEIERAVKREPDYCFAIRRKIERLADVHAENSFAEKLRNRQIFTREFFSLKRLLEPGRTSTPLNKSLYELEGHMNSFEERMITLLANQENVVFWHRNLDRREFMIRGFITHYPDFMVQLKSGRIILIETKGDHLDGENTKAKIRLGNAWAKEAGDKYEYFMLFEHKYVEGALTLDQAIASIRQL